jgi:branched-chain amino acid aminotransferase
MLDYEIEERTITPFEIQRADEVFTTNVIRGITPIHKYRKKEFNSELAETLTTRLNELLF